MTVQLNTADRWVETTREQREEVAALLERQAAQLRRGEFDVDLFVSTNGDYDDLYTRTHITVEWCYGDKAPWVETWDEFHGREHDGVYDSRTVNGRRAHAYLNAHDPDSGAWFLRIHHQDDMLRDRYIGGRVLADARGRGFLAFSREEAIAAADTWAHHEVLPEHAR